MTARDSGQLGRSDGHPLAFAAEADRVLLTHNWVDFERLYRRRLESGRRHGGIIIARRRLPGELTARLGRLLNRLTAEDLASQLYYA